MRTILSRALSGLLAVALVSGCKKKPDAPAVVVTRPNFISRIPTLARAIQVDTAGSDDAERVTWRSNDVRYDSVVGYYRYLLPTMGFALQSDEGDSATANLFYTRDTLALWMHFEKKGERSTEWTVLGSRTTAAVRADSLAGH